MVYASNVIFVTLQSSHLVDGHLNREAQPGYVGTQLSAYRRQLGMSAIVAVIPIVVLFIMLGALRKPAWMSALTALGSAFVIALGVYGMPATGGGVDCFRRRVRHVSDRLDCFQFDHAVPPRGRYREVRNDQEHDRRALPMTVGCRPLHRVFIWCIHRRSCWIRGARSRFGRHACGPGIQSVLCGGHLPAGQYGAGRFWSIGTPILTLANVTGLPTAVA